MPLQMSARIQPGATAWPIAPASSLGSIMMIVGSEGKIRSCDVINKRSMIQSHSAWAECEKVCERVRENFVGNAITGVAPSPPKP